MRPVNNISVYDASNLQSPTSSLSQLIFNWSSCDICQHAENMTMKSPQQPAFALPNLKFHKSLHQREAFLKDDPTMVPTRFWDSRKTLTLPAFKSKMSLTAMRPSTSQKCSVRGTKSGPPPYEVPFSTCAYCSSNQRGYTAVIFLSTLAHNINSCLHHYIDKIGDFLWYRNHSSHVLCKAHLHASHFHQYPIPYPSLNRVSPWNWRRPQPY